jgi:hypothetical protein
MLSQLKHRLFSGCRDICRSSFSAFFSAMLQAIVVRLYCACCSRRAHSGGKGSTARRWRLPPFCSC